MCRLCFRAGLYWQGLTHDNSKYSPTEFWRGVKYYQGYRSPNAAEREDKGYSLAWLHHKGRNRHHFEYWIDICKQGDFRPVEGASYEPGGYTYCGMKMPVRFVVEMFCDRIAASKVYLKDKYTDASPLEYFHREQDGNALMMHPDTQALLLLLLTRLASEGEEAAFAFIRSTVRTQGYECIVSPASLENS